MRPCTASLESQSMNGEHFINAVLEDVIRRRQAGEELPDHQVLDTHPDLKSELAARLFVLRQVEHAERRAKVESGSEAESMPAAVPAWLTESLSGYNISNESYRGGQGAVYRATQRTTGRDVAIKVVRGGAFPGRNEDVRFRREIQILGRLQHPGIVPIHDSGVAGECRYFVMDFIAGEPLASFVESHRCTVVEIVQLLVRVCEAVHAAHVRGVIHRDLKPSNIRVDSQGTPYILDFGLAKVSTHDASQDQQVTMTGEFVGSLPWASPEQAMESPDLVDLRSDIYSLGVMLYRFLTGRFPYPVVGAMRRILSNIAEVEPIRPRLLRPDLDPDLEVIILTCLEKDPERRYQSAAALGDDLRRFLGQEPILARAPNAVYRFRKLVRRHRLPAALLLTLAVTVIGFAVGMSILYARAATARDRAQEAESLAEIRRLNAEEEAERTTALNEFMARVLQIQSPWIRKTALLGNAKTPGKDVRLSELLDEAVTWIDRDFAEQPELEATVRLNLGQSFATIGRDAEALPLIQRALEIRRELFGDEDPRTMECSLAMPLPVPADPEELELMNRENWETCRRLFGDHHPLTFWAAKDLLLTWIVIPAEAAEFEQLARRTIAIQREAFDPPYDPAVQSFLANFLVYQHRLDEGESLARETMEMAQDQGGADEYWVGFNNVLLARVARHRGDFEEAEERLRDAIELQMRAQGPDNELTAIPILRLGQLLYATGRFDEAEPYLRTALEMNRRARGTFGDYTPPCIYELGRVLGRMGKFAEGEELLRSWLDDCQRDLGPDHSETYNAMSKLAELLFEEGVIAEAEPLARAAVEGLRRTAGKRDYAARAARTLAGILCDLERFEEAEPLFAEALAGFQDRLRIDRMIVPGLQLQYGRCLTSWGRFEEAEPLLLEGHSDFASLPRETDNLAQSVLESIIELYEAWGKDDQLAIWYPRLHRP